MTVAGFPLHGRGLRLEILGQHFEPENGKPLCAFIKYPHLINILQSQSFFPYWYGHPEGALVVFEPVLRHPGCSSGKLYLIQNNKNIREMGLVKKPPSS